MARRTIFSTDYEVQLGSDIEDCYREICAEDDREYDEEDLYHYIDACMEDECDRFFNSLPNIRVIGVAEVETWCGVRHGYAVKKLHDFFCNYDDIDVEYDEDKDRLYLLGHHHDGTNEVYFVGLTKKGQDYYDRHYYDENIAAVIEHMLETKGYTKKFTKRDFEYEF